MKIVFYSSIFFTDCDFSLIREMQRHGIEITNYIQIVKGKQCRDLLDLRSYNLFPGMYDVRNFPKFNNKSSLTQPTEYWRETERII